MIQVIQSILIPETAAASQPAQPDRPPEIWGLSAPQLHDAFWRSKGVQCVRRGRRQKLQRSAELYLLVEPDQLVLFNIAQMTERLTWHNAAVTRLRLVDEGEQRYSEHVLTDDSGQVQRIERRYRPSVQGSSRVMLTSARRVAAIWMAARSRREGWDRVRRSVPWSRVDHWKCAGVAFIDGNIPQERQLLVELVDRWPRPDQAISGLEEIEPGVWHAVGESIMGGVVRIGPLWLGRGAPSADRRCIVGPAYIEDRPPKGDADRRTAMIKEIADVELPDQSMLDDQAMAPKAYPFLKRAFDIAGSLLALAALMPVMLLIALAILIEDGRPLFFGHRRQGRNGTPFRCWKFRTMHRNAEKIVRELDQFNRADGPQVLIPNDPRVTRVGRLLRKTNLDELPQFWNVLTGHMSLVGPRPSPDDENQYCPAWRDLRLSVRPGITGLWQLKRTREPGEDFQEWIKYDIQYVLRANLWMDIVILARTAHMLLLARRRSRAPE